MMLDIEEYQLAEKTWNEFYHDRRPFSAIGESAQQEWIKVFAVYRKHLFEFEDELDDVATLS